ncbi:MAG: hypothetical protein IJD79_04890 [Clostridia bacterium]|nr:hypothetical protein [Clostridia bacterium]
MKKSISLFVLLTTLMTLLLTSCGSAGSGEVSYGIGIHKSYEKLDASESSSGKAGVIYTVASTLADKNGKIVKCKIDVIEAVSEVTASGEVEIPSDFKTKRELGDSYVMSTDPGKLKWYEQADAFARLAEGKTLSGVKNMVTGDGTGNGKVISAGCTITVSEFALAIEDSMKNMKDITLENIKTVKDIELKISTKATKTDATDSTDGKVTYTTALRAALVTDDKSVENTDISREITDSFAFDKNGKISK